MKNGFKIKWTFNALKELEETISYLEKNCTSREIRRLSRDIEKTIKLISINPSLFPASKNKNIRRAVVKKLNTIYYRKINNETVEIISFFSNRTKPKYGKKLNN